jgi:hypothetical protein
MRLRELRIDDYDGTAAVLVRNGLRRPTREQWAYLWNANPHRDRLAGIAAGWVLEDDAGIVGTFRNIPFLYEWNERPIRVVVASAWAVDPAHRHQSLRLAIEYFKQPNADILLNTTAVEETSGKAFLKFRAERVPQPSYTTRFLWITGYIGFAANLLHERRVPAAAILQYAAASGVKMADVVRGGFPRRYRDRVVTVDAFDARFDRFWSALRQRRNRLRAVRDAATLAWRFALEREPPTIVALLGGDSLAGYAVLVHRNQRELRRFEVADLQTLDDDCESVAALMNGALQEAARQGVHLVAMSGHSAAKREALRALTPHVKATPGWPLYYKAVDSALEEPLRSPDAWDLSLYDGDALWSGMFADSAVA